MIKEPKVDVQIDGPSAISAVPYRWIVCRCPKCGAANPPVMRTVNVIRYHKCACGHNFKSYESDAD